MRKWVELFKRLKIKERLDGEINASGWLSQNTNQVDTMKEEDVTSEKEVEESDNSEEFEGGFEVSEEEKDEKDPSNASDMDFDDFMNEIGI